MRSGEFEIFPSNGLDISCIWGIYKRYVELRNLARNFDKHGHAELPDLVQKIMEKPTFHGTGEIFHFLSAEFPFSEHKIPGSQFRAPYEF